MHYNLFEDLWTELPFWIGGSSYDTLAHLADVSSSSSSTTDHLQQAQLQQQQDFFGLYQDPCIAGIQCTTMNVEPTNLTTDPFALNYCNTMSTLPPPTTTSTAYNSPNGANDNTFMMAASSSTPLHLLSQQQPPLLQQQPRRRVKSMPSSQDDYIPRQQQPRFKDDQYSPKWVRYSGQLKEGYCDTCPEGRWLQLKNSAYWYHKQFYHGISSVTGRPFAEPLEQRVGPDGVLQGLCHQCICFVPICNGRKRRNSLLWYKHAHKCHAYTKPEKFPSLPF
ncbi:conserved fungal protein [Lichtheimia corymbifera JMRC:FSU:9682]|uniref:Conserved fungal protein n=1 Tax=Lichtheimia corymbifera JMRC:FSU:9682 TaxID=1263082 RepID=A0A068RVR8_9FUNG|nr:conserved fungal protein [Lichtheimia corymbifera JMRC:FSU:9682]